MNEAFLADLEKMLSPDDYEVGGIGDVALAHFKDKKGFENYKQYYAKREEAQGIFEREVRKTSGSGFSAFIDVRPVPLLYALTAPCNPEVDITIRLLPSTTPFIVPATVVTSIAHQICWPRQQESRRPP